MIDVRWFSGKLRPDLQRVKVLVNDFFDLKTGSNVKFGRLVANEIVLVA